jgi:hypothetical protein
MELRATHESHCLPGKTRDRTKAITLQHYNHIAQRGCRG